MGYALSGKIAALKPYDPIAGVYPVRLDANESYLDLPPFLREKISAGLSEIALNRYPDPLAVRACAAAAAAYGVRPRCVTAGNGSDELISILLACFLEKGDTVLTLSPDFSMYPFYAALYEADCAVLEKGPDAAVSGAEIAAKIRETGARAVVFSTPCNPTSVGMERAEVRSLLRSTDALVILDEAYMDFWDQSLLGEAEEYDNLVILKTCSKAVGLANIRLGFAVANERITDALRAVKSPYNVNGVSAMIGAAVLEQRDYLREAAAELVASRQALSRELESLLSRKAGAYRIYPSRTNFLYVSMPDAGAVFAGLKERGIIVRCLGSHLRITAGSEAENAALTAALDGILV